MSVRIERAGEHVAELLLDRPEALNALSTAQAEDLHHACVAVTEDRTVRAVVLSSAVAKAFCVGADLKERSRFTDADLRAQRPVLSACFAAVRALPPAVAAVEGYAMGGGCELALSCDLIVAGRSAVFALPEVGVGLVPGGGGTQLLTRRIGYNRAADVVLTARHIGGEEAVRLGLADRLTDPGDARRTALELALTIAGNSPVGTRHAKLALRDGYDLPLDDGLAVEEQAWFATAFSPDRHEGIAAFVAKREPVWPEESRGPDDREGPMAEGPDA